MPATFGTYTRPPPRGTTTDDLPPDLGSRDDPGHRLQGRVRPAQLADSAMSPLRPRLAAADAGAQAVPRLPLALLGDGADAKIILAYSYEYAILWLLRGEGPKGKGKIMTREEVIEIVNADVDVTTEEVEGMFEAVFGRPHDPDADGHAYSMICEEVLA